MSSSVGASGERRSSRVGTCRTEGAGRKHDVHIPCLKATRPGVESENPAGEGRSSCVGQQARPAWPGRKSHKKTCIKDNKPTHEDVAQNRQEEQRITSPSSIQLDVGEGPSNLSGSHLCPACSRSSIADLNVQSPQAASSASPQLSPRTRRLLLSSQRPSPRTADPDCSSCSPPSEPDLFCVNVRTEAAARQSSQSHHAQTHITTVTSSALGDEEEEEEEEEEEDPAAGDGVGEGSGVQEVGSRTMTLALVPPCSSTGERRTSKREKNRMRGLRRRQRRRERWRQSQQESRQQSSTGNASSSSSGDEEDLSARARDGCTCAVCLDVYFSPYMCHPCNHVFCEPCLRTLARNSPTNTPCPLCRTVITHVFFQKELNQTTRTFFPKEYLTRKQNFQKASCATWPLPSCRKIFRIFGGFQGSSSPVARRQGRHGGGYRVDTVDFEDQSHGWRFDLDMIVIYIHSVNWVIGFFIFGFLCYLFFPSI